MTIEIKVICDGFGCCNEIYLDGESLYNESEQIIEAGWNEDPDNNCWHYCKQCWEEIKSDNGM